MLARRAVAWAWAADLVPLYPLYALLFADTGLSDADISGLFALWTVVAVVAEVPSGALADRYTRRGALVAGALLQALGFALWTAWPVPLSFAAGFVLWGLGGALVSGAFEALLYDGLAAAGAAGQFARVYGRVTAAGLLVQFPTVLAATALFAVGGFALVGWVSVGSCLITAVLAGRLPEPARAGPNADATDSAADGGLDGAPGGWLVMLRAGLTEAASHPAVRTVLIALVLLAGWDAIEEYFPLLARDWGVRTVLNPLALLGIWMAGAAGALIGGRATGCSPRWPAALLAVAATGFGLAGVMQRPAGVAVIALAYGLYQLVLVVVGARLQEAITGPARATVTSVAGLGTELAALGLLASWALGGVLLVAALLAAGALALPRLLRDR